VKNIFNSLQNVRADYLIDKKSRDSAYFSRKY